MPQFPKDHVFILPHAQEYQRFYGVSTAQVLSCLNEPDLREGLAEDHYTVEKTFHGQKVYVYYYLTLPLQGERDEAYAIVDFVGYTEQDDTTSEDHATAVIALLQPCGWKLSLKTRQGKKYAYAEWRKSREVKEVHYLGPLEDIAAIKERVATLPDKSASDSYIPAKKQ